MTRSSLALSLLAILPAMIEASRYTLHHRLGPSSAWSPRGIVTLDEIGGNPTYEDTTGKLQPWDALSDFQEDSSDLYQLALTVEGTSSVGLESPMTFARACLLSADAAESITIHHAGTGSQSEPYAFGYDLIGLDASKLSSSGCPLQRSNTKTGPKPLNIQVAVPEAPLSPLPPSPPPVKADGTPVKEGEEPPPEKSFVAKYWMYLLPVILLMAIPTELADSANEESDGVEGEDPFQGGAAQRPIAGKGGARKR